MSKGKSYIPAIAPKHLERGKVGDCFDTCVLAAVRHGVKYVEGAARNPLTKEWILHAWVTDGVHAWDLTWQANINGVEQPVPTEYIGLEMDTRLVVDFMRATKYKGILDNAWRDLERVNKILC